MKLILLLAALFISSSAFAYTKTQVDDIKKFAGQGDPIFQFNLGLMYANGEGVPENDKEAVVWYRKAADQGDVKAQFNLGVMYDYGIGVPENSVRAYVWMSMAKTQEGETKKVKKSFDMIKSKMTKQQIAEAQNLASKCYESNYKDCG
jgi:TPR repeat protein